MNRINSLTPEQTAYLPVFRQKWFNIGACTDPADRPKAERAISDMYAYINKPSPTFIWCDSPLTSNMAIKVLRDSLGDSLQGSLWDSLVGSLWGSLQDSLGGSLQDSLWDSLQGSLWGSLWDSLRESLWDSLGDSLSTCFWGQCEARWVSFYVFCEYIGVRYSAMTKKKLDVWQRYCESAFWAWPFENTCIISDRPEEIHWDTRGNRLHNDSGPSVKFRDGWAIYNLNGVRVPDWLAVTPAMEIDVKKFAEISNAEVRREFVRKVGVERLVQKLGAVTLDTQGDYALLSVDLGGETGKWPYLKMLNPSIKVWHLECVGKECKTVQDAINFRASQLKSLNNDWNPEVIT